MALTAKERDALNDTDFAVPETRELPIHDAVHTGMAWRVVDNTKGLTQDQRASAKRNILRKAYDFGMDTSKWHLQAMSFAAMALAFPDAGDSHSNKLPFTGVLTRLDRPSDKPLNGTGGKRVILPSAVAEAALASLLGMAIDFKKEFDGHRPKVKIGLITSANVVDDAVEIAGFFYAADFPEEVQFIQAEAGKLGFSFEAQSLIQDMKADPLVVEACEFTGAAVLFKDKAAYFNTSIAADAAQEPRMNDEEKKMLLAMQNSITALTDAVAKIAMSVSQDAIMDAAKCAVKAAADEAAADKATVKAAADKAANDATILALAAANDSVTSLTTKLADLEAKIAASATGAVNPERKTLSAAAAASLKRIGLEAAADKTLSITEIDAAAKKAGLNSQSSIALKLALKDAGMIA